MNIILLDEPNHAKALLPFTFTRPVAAIRMGIFTIAEKWENWSDLSVSHCTADYLQALFPTEVVQGKLNLLVNGAVLPTQALVKAALSLSENEYLVQGNEIIAFATSHTPHYPNWEILHSGAIKKTWEGEALQFLNHTWDIFGFCGSEIRKDFEWIKSVRSSEVLKDSHTIIYHPENVFIEPGADIKASVINAEGGPVYIGRNAQVQEGCLIRGPFALGEGSVLNMGAKIRGDSSFGPGCKVGGEVSNSVLLGFSNKGHDGFLGNSVLGEWCNLGADTNTSNLKNNYSQVKVWNYAEQDYVNTGRLFCGLIMGDHSKAGINTMFNTGTVVGLGCNVFGGGFPQKYVPNFYWGGADSGFVRYRLPNFLETEVKVMARRNTLLSPEYQALIEYLYEHKGFVG